MGWIVIAALASLTAGALWRWGGLPRAAWEPVGAALFLGLAGYALLGSPGQGGSPARATADTASADDAALAGVAGRRFPNAAGYLQAADGAMQAGLKRSAVALIKQGIAEHPNDADLWVGLGNALVVHADGMVSPAAQFAFQRGASLSPEHPGPPFFFGLALAQSGQTDRARAIWQELLERSPPDAPWRADLQARLAQLAAVQPVLPTP